MTATRKPLPKWIEKAALEYSHAQYPDPRNQLHRSDCYSAYLACAHLILDRVDATEQSDDKFLPDLKWERARESVRREIRGK